MTVAPELPAAEPSSVLNALRVLRERWWIVALCVVLGAVAGGGYAASQPRVYEATAKLLLRESGLDELVSNGATLDVRPERDVATNLQIIESIAVAERVRKALGLPYDASDVLDQVDAQLVPESDIVTIVASDEDPARAAAIATSFARQYRAFRQEAQRNAIRQGAELLRERIESLPADATASRAQLEQALPQVNALEAVQTGDAEVIDEARPPSSPSSPRPRRDAILGLLLGGVLGAALAFVADLLDRRVKTAERFEALYGLRTLTVIPERPRAARTARERQAEIEPFRILRAGLGVSGDLDSGVVLVTSAVAGEGKTTVAIGMTRAAALAGKRVVLVECDMRRPVLRARLDLGDDETGLSTALVRGADVDELLRRPVPGMRTLSILPSGPPPPAPAELLGSEEFRRILARLRERFDYVVLDAPPLLPVADTHVLAEVPGVDGILVVARAYVTGVDEVRRARAILDRADARRVGLAVNGVHNAGAGYDYYGQSEAPVSSSRKTPAQV